MLSLCMIVKNEEDTLERVLNSAKDYVDEICITDTGSTDKTIEIAERFGAKVSHLKWDKDFAAARNFNFSQATGDWILWLDADDILRGGDKIAGLIAEAEKRKIDAYQLKYYYAFTDGVCTILQWRERLIRRDVAEWKGRIHEAMIPLRKMTVARSEDVSVAHHPLGDHFQLNSQRNIDIALADIEEQGGVENADPRTIYHLANGYLGIDRFDDAIKYYLEFIKKSGWEEEIYLAWHRAGFALMKLGAYRKALDAEYEAIKMMPQYPDAYFGAAQAYFELGDYDKAEEMCKATLQRKPSERAVVSHPRDHDVNPLWLWGHIWLQRNDVKKAIPYFEKVSQIVPKDEKVKELLKQIKETADLQDLCNAAANVGDKIGKRGVKKYLELLPKEVKNSPHISALRAKYLTRTKSDGKELAIYCGNCWEEWDASIVDTGIGGSEEATINVAKRLAKKGWKVSVFGSPVGGEPVEYDGVKYIPFYEFNPKDKWDVFISWRQPHLFDVNINATKKYCWLHDTTDEAEFTPERLAKIDKIFVLSQYHRSLYPNIPDSKFILSANGVEMDYFDQPVERNNHLIINTSAPNRGIKTLLELWPEIRKQVPDARLIWAYGWQSYDKGNGDNVQGKLYKEEVQRLLQQEGVEDWGRIGHKEVAELHLRAGIWSHFTEFPEISCISAMKAQVAGSIPICTTFAALNETVQHGVKLDYADCYTNKKAQKEYVKAVVKEMTKPTDRKAMIKWARQKYTWDAVADQWHDLFVSA